MKKIVLLAIVAVVLSCRAQRPVSQVTATQVKALGIIFNIEKTTSDFGNKYVAVANISNELTNVKQSIPKLPHNMRSSDYMIYDKAMVIKICSDAIPLDALKKMAKDTNERLTVQIKFNPSGLPVDVIYVMRETSLITANDLAKIEATMKKSSFRLTFKKEALPFLTGANFFNIRLPINYSDMLNAKIGK